MKRTKFKQYILENNIEATYFRYEAFEKRDFLINFRIFPVMLVLITILQSINLANDTNINYIFGTILSLVVFLFVFFLMLSLKRRVFLAKSNEKIYIAQKEVHEYDQCDIKIIQLSKVATQIQTPDKNYFISGIGTYKKLSTWINS